MRCRRRAQRHRLTRAIVQPSPPVLLTSCYYAHGSRGFLVEHCFYFFLFFPGDFPPFLVVQGTLLVDVFSVHEVHALTFTSVPCSSLVVLSESSLRRLRSFRENFLSEDSQTPSAVSSAPGVFKPGQGKVCFPPEYFFPRTSTVSSLRLFYADSRHSPSLEGRGDLSLVDQRPSDASSETLPSSFLPSLFFFG